MTGVFALAVLWVSLAPGNASLTAASISVQALALLGLIFLIVLRFTAGREAMDRVWLTWGNWRYWLFFGLAVVAYYVLQAVLNAVTGLGGATLSSASPYACGP